MPAINLIQEQRTLIRQKEGQIRALALVTVGLGAIAFLAAGYFMFEAARNQVMYLALEEKKRAMKPKLEQLAANQREAGLLKPRLTTLQEAVKTTGKWSNVLNHLSVNMPAGVWLTNVRCSSATSTKPTTITFIGHGTNLELIGEFMARLGLCTDVNQPVLRFTQERMVGRTALLEFEISAEMKGAPEKKKVADKEKA
jgi:Tfp pilus assembly protein PilN